MRRLWLMGFRELGRGLNGPFTIEQDALWIHLTYLSLQEI